MKRRSKQILYAVIALFLAVLAVRIVFLVTKGPRNNQQFQATAVAVEVGRVAYGPIEDIREFTGSVYPYNQYVVAPKVSGRIIQIRKRIGDRVRSGELIARVDDAEYVQAMREAEASLKIAQASVAESASQLELARQDKERMESIVSKGLASTAEMDAALTNYLAQESRYKLAQAQVEQREAALKTSTIRLGYTKLSASRAGFIGERFVDEGALLAPNSAVVSVIEIDSVIVRTTITERDYGLIEAGQPVEVTVDAFPSRSFSGHVSRIAPMLQEASRVAQMEVEVDNHSLQLKPGMFASVSVMIASKERAQIVPSEAVVSRGDERGIFVVKGGEPVAHYISVETGIVTPHLTEILSPRIEGLVVTLGQHLLNDGSPVLLPAGAADTTSESEGGTDTPARPTGTDAAGAGTVHDSKAEPASHTQRKSTQQ
jgi:RND family efflux transporter MFP subunit